MKFKVGVIKEQFIGKHPLPKLKQFKWISFDDKSALEEVDIFVQSNQLGQKYKKLDKYYYYILESKKPFIVVESAVFRRNVEAYPSSKSYHRFSWFSYFRDQGNYNNDNCPPDRWEQIQQDQNIEIKDWKTTRSTDSILLILQRPGDSSLVDLVKQYGNYENFLIATVEEIRKNTDRKIIVRPHPSRAKWQIDIIERSGLKDIEISQNLGAAGALNGGDNLYKDFENSHAVIGFNSNALTESACAGIPTFSLSSSSMAWEISNTDLSKIEMPIYPDRQQWLNNLGYTQWRYDEVERGDPYHHLMKIYDSIKDARK